MAELEAPLRTSGKRDTAVDMANTPPSPLLPLWMAFLGTQVAFAVAPWIVSNSAGVSAEGAASLGTFLPVIAVFDYALSFIVPRKLLRKAGESLPPGTGVAAPSDAEVLRLAAPALVIQYALLEFVSLLGLAHAFMTHNPAAALPYAALGILSTAMARPDASRLRPLLARAA